MPDATSPVLPEWVSKRDGRLVPFQPDKISQALFAASESLGRPDAFLSRELTDGVLHFLAAETASTIPSTEQIADLVIKIVRELGQPDLSAAFAEGNRRRLKSHEWRVASDEGRPGELRPTGSILPVPFSPNEDPAQLVRCCLQEFSLRAIFGRDLAAAHREGLLTLGGLEAPHQLAGCIMELAGRGLEASGEAAGWAHSRRSGALVRALQELRSRAGSFLVIEGPEYALTPFASASDLARNSGELAAGLEATGLGAVVNLNSSRPPAWAEGQVEGPLFAEQRRTSPPAHVEEFRGVLLEHLLGPEFAGRLRIDWHLSEGDFPGNGPGPRLSRLVRLALDSPSLGFVFDRPERAVALAEGIDARHPAVLQVIGLHLPRLLEMPEVHGDMEKFLVKLASLARMAVSAAVQKRQFLRRLQPNPLTRGFLLDRARLVVVPVGLERAVQALTGQASTATAGLELARQVVASLFANLRQAGQRANLEVCVDSPCWSRYAAAAGFCLGEPSQGLALSPREVAGLTTWDPGAEPKSQLKAAGALHAAAEGGTAAILFSEDNLPGPELLADLLHFAWKRTPVHRLRFLRLPHQQAQLEFGKGEE